MEIGRNLKLIYLEDNEVLPLKHTEVVHVVIIFERSRNRLLLVMNDHKIHCLGQIDKPLPGPDTAIVVGFLDLLTVAQLFEK